MSTKCKFTHKIKGLNQAHSAIQPWIYNLVNKCDNTSGTCDHLYGKWHINIVKFGRFTVYSATTNTLLPWLRIYSFKTDICNSDNAINLIRKKLQKLKVIASQDSFSGYCLLQRNYGFQKKLNNNENYGHFTLHG